MFSSLFSWHVIAILYKHYKPSQGVIVQSSRCEFEFIFHHRIISKRLRSLPTFRGRKNRLFFYFTKLNSITQPNVSMKKCSEIVKSTRATSKTYFQIKVNKSGKCHNLGPGRISQQPLILGLVFHVISIFCLHRALGSSFLKEKSLLMEKSKVFGKRKGKKKQAQRRKKEYHSVKKRKNCVVIAIGTDVAPRWRPDFEQRSRRQTSLCHVT